MSDKGKQSQLRQAAEKGDVVEVRRLIAAGVKINAVDGVYGRTALHLAAFEGHNSVVINLITAQADINGIDKNGKCALHMAAERGHDSVVQTLIAAHANATHAFPTLESSFLEWNTNDGYQGILRKLTKIGIPNKEKILYIYLAFLSTKKELPQLLFTNGININQIDGRGQTALHMATQRHNLEVMRKLLDYSANPNLQDTQGRTPLHLAILNAARLLLEKSEKINAARRLLEKLAYIKAASLLLEKSADPNFQDIEGRTPLHIATEANCWEAVKLLIGKLVDPKLDGKPSKTPTKDTFEKGYLDRDSLQMKILADLNIQDALGMSALHIAVETNYPEMAKLLVEATANINLQDKHGRTPLHIATKQNDFVIFRLLAQSKANTNLQDNQERTPLHMAVKRNSLEKISLLVKHSADLNIQDAEGKTPLHIAAKENKPETISLLVKHSPNLNIQDAEGKTPLHIATKENKMGIISLLVNHTPNLNIQDAEGRTPLHIATEENNKESISLLLYCFADHKIQDREGRTPLHVATEAKCLEAVKMLVRQASAEINLQDMKGQTPLHIAVEGNSLDIVRLLVIHLAALNLTDLQGRRPLHLAAERNNKDIIKILVDTSVELNCQDLEGRTPLHVAVEAGSMETVRQLVGLSVDLNLQDSKGRSPLHVAVEVKNLEAASLLVENSVNPDIKDLHGNTALDLATEAKDADIIALFTQINIESTIFLSLDSDLHQDKSKDSLREQYLLNPKLLLKHIYPLGKCLDSPDFGKVNETEIHREILREVSRVIQNLMSLTEKNTRLLGLKQGQLINVGSSKENTKISKPNEYDFLAVCNAKNMNPCVHIRGLPLCPPGLVYLINCNLHEVHNPTELNSTLENEEHVTLLSSVKFHRWFWENLTNAIQDEAALLSGVKHLKLKYSPNHGYLDNKACSTITLIWTGEQYHGMDIEADLTLALKFEGECPFLSPHGELPNHYYLVPKPPHRNSLLGLAFEDEVREAMWQVDFVAIESEKISSLPQTIKDAYITCKCIRAMIPHINVSGVIQKPEKFVSSYMIKLLFLKEKDTFEKQNTSLEQMVLNVFDQLVNYLEKEHLPDNWTFQIPYTGQHPEIEKILPHSYEHINVLAGSKRDIKHCLQVARLLKFVAQELVQHNEVIEEIIKHEDYCTYATLRVYDAAADGDNNLAEMLLKCDAKFNIPTKGGLTTIHHACMGGHLDMVGWLVEQGVDLTHTDLQGCNALHHASAGGHVHMVDWLVEQGFDLTLSDHQGCTAVHHACAGGHVAMAEFLWEYGVDFTQKDSNQRTVLHHACIGGNNNMVKWLLKSEIYDVSAKDVNNISPLLAALINQHMDVANTVIDSGFEKSKDLLQLVHQGTFHTAKHKCFKEEEMEDALLIAATKEQVDNVNYLINAGVSYHHFLRVLGESGTVNVITCLISGGGNTEALLLAATKEGNMKMLKTLIDGGGDDQLALKTAAAEGNLSIINNLISGGADHQKALILAAKEGGNIDVIKNLIKGGADHEAAFLTAAKNGDIKVMTNLEAAGVDISGALLEKMMNFGKVEVKWYLTKKFPGFPFKWHKLTE